MEQQSFRSTEAVSVLTMLKSNWKEHLLRRLRHFEAHLQSNFLTELFNDLAKFHYHHRRGHWLCYSQAITLFQSWQDIIVSSIIRWFTHSCSQSKNWQFVQFLADHDLFHVSLRQQAILELKTMVILRQKLPLLQELTVDSENFNFQEQINLQIRRNSHSLKQHLLLVLPRKEKTLS